MSSDIYTNITEDTQEQEPISIDPEQFLRTANCLSEFSEDA